MLDITGVNWLAVLVAAAAGLPFGLLVGAGVVATVSFNTYLFSRRPVVLYLIDIGYPVVALALTGVILGLRPFAGSVVRVIRWACSADARLRAHHPE